MGSYRTGSGGFFSRFFGRRRHSLDGSVPGADYNRYVAGASPASGQIHGPYGSFSSSGQSEYDPTVAAYDFQGPSYEPPPAWFEGMTQPPPMPVSEARFSDHRPIPGFHVPEVSYDDSLMTPELTARAWAEQFVAEPPAQSGGLEQLLVREPQASALEMLVTDSYADMTAPPEPADQDPQAPFEAMQAMYDQQQDFEEHAQPSPEQFDPMQEAQQVFDEQMQQLQDPFMMPGFGPGP